MLPFANGPGVVSLPVIVVAPVAKRSRIKNPDVSLSNGSTCANVAPANMFVPPLLGSNALLAVAPDVYTGQFC